MELASVMGLMYVLIGLACIYPARNIFKKDPVDIFSDKEYINKKTRSIVFAVIAVWLTLSGVFFLILKNLF